MVANPARARIVSIRTPSPSIVAGPLPTEAEAARHRS